MRTADYPALYRIFAFGFWRKRNGGRATRLHRLFNSKIGNVKSVLYVGRSHVQRNRLPALHSDNGGLNRVLAHDYIDVRSGTFALVASCREEKETYKDKVKQEIRFHIQGIRAAAEQKVTPWSESLDWALFYLELVLSDCRT